MISFSGKYPDIFNDEIIDLFLVFLKKPIDDLEVRLEGIQTRVPNAMNKLFLESISSMDKASFFPEFAKVEPFLKKIVYFIDRPKFIEIESARSGLAACIDFLGLNPTGIRLDRTSPESVVGNPDFLEHILRCYYLRNIESHKCKTWTNKELYVNVESILVVYLYCIYLHSDVLRKVLLFQPHFNSYLEKVVSDFEIWRERFVHITGIERFDEIPIHAIESEDWGKSDKVGLREGKIDELRKSIDENSMVILGEPGMGKSTTLQYMSYNDAKSILSGDDNLHKIPVYIELKLLSRDESVFGCCLQKLEITSEQLSELFGEGRITLFLDGLNEVYYELRKPIRHEIAQLLNDYKRLFIIITSRPLAYSNEFKNTPVFNLQKLNDEQVEEFLLKNCAQEKIRLMLIKEINVNARLGKIVRVPLLLKMLVNVVLNNGGAIPENKTKIIYHFIQNLYKREREKQIETIDLRIIHRLLCFLGHSTRSINASNVGWRIEQFETIIERRIERSRFNLNVYEFIDMAVDLHILVRDGEKYSFIHELYQEYFASEELFRLNPVDHD